DDYKEIDTRFSQLRVTGHKWQIDKVILSDFEKRFRLKEFNELIEKYDNSQLVKKIRRSLDWFLKSYLDDEPNDFIISLFVSIEALISLSSEAGRGYSNELAENASLFIAFNAADRYTWKTKFRTDYDLRNAILHAGERVPEKEIYALQQRLRIYFVWSFLGFLNESQNLIKNYGLRLKEMRIYFDKRKLSG
ncbi:MAG: hypothetical protein V1673_03045, partial [Candidatus Omnitrophota bacterium]